MVLPSAMIMSSIGAFHNPQLCSYLVLHLCDSRIHHLRTGDCRHVHEFLVGHLKHTNDRLPLPIVRAQRLLDFLHRVLHGAVHPKY
jgi:hypothetical protein